MASALDEIIKSPRFPSYVENLQQLLAEERRRRERFYEEIDEQVEQVQQHLAHEGRFELRATLGSGNIRSSVIEGFDVPVRALFDSQVNLRVLGQLAQAQGQKEPMEREQTAKNREE